MAADWSSLRRFLTARSGDRVTIAWSDLDAIVGGMPASAVNHAAWWGGDRPHTRAWRGAGFVVESKRPGESVTFRRASDSSMAAGPPQVQSRLAAEPFGTKTSRSPDLLLIPCVKTKRPTPAAAQDLYTSTLFAKERAYAEELGVPWFILSAQWGLVAPDDWLSPYELRLDDTSAAYREAWGAWVAARLAHEVGELAGVTIEIHAGQAYLEPLSQPLRRLGARLTTPLAGLTQGQRLAWYDARRPAESPSVRVATVEAGAVTRFVELLRDEGAARSPDVFLASERSVLNAPGLYSWWVDSLGAGDLSAGLGHEVTEGMIYAGLAGATRWPSGRRSTNTLWLRIAGMHLGGRHDFSTFRRSLGSVLAQALGWEAIEENNLTRWMHEHLRVVAEPYADVDKLGRLETVVLRTLDPPLNLQGMTATPVRRRLSELRRRYGSR